MTRIHFLFWAASRRLIGLRFTFPRKLSPLRLTPERLSDAFFQLSASEDANQWIWEGKSLPQHIQTHHLQCKHRPLAAAACVGLRAPRLTWFLLPRRIPSQTGLAVIASSFVLLAKVPRNTSQLFQSRTSLKDFLHARRSVLPSTSRVAVLRKKPEKGAEHLYFGG